MPDARRDGGETDAAARYDFDRLDRAVRFLLEEHERLSAEREALLGELVEREQRIAALEAQLDRERVRRASAIDGVDRVLARLEELHSNVTTAAETA
jgi:hypothetical protein